VRASAATGATSTLTVPCVDGIVTLPSIGVGDQTIVAQGVTAGATRFFGTAVLSNVAAHSAVAVDLRPTFVDLDVRWGDCGAESNVDVQARFGSDVVGVAVACAAGKTLFALPASAAGAAVSVSLRPNQSANATAATVTVGVGTTVVQLGAVPQG
jgi:hypothetical protein